MSASPCESCHSGCCRSFAVPVTGADILRIESRLKLDFWQFVCRWADPEDRIAGETAPHFRFADEPDTPFAICLMHSAGSFRPETTKCRFLIECEPDEMHLLGKSRCGIYNARPAACRAFPSKLADDGNLVVLSEISSKAHSDGDPVYELCPREWTPQDVDAVELMQNLVVCRHEMRFFRQIADVWNRAPRAWELFPEFLRLVYRNRVVTQQTAEQWESRAATIPFPQHDRDSARAA